MVSETMLLRAALVLVVLAGIAFRLRDLRTASLWYDEIFGVALARQPPGVLLDVMAGFVANMALYLVFMHVWLALLDPSISDAVPRLPSTLIGVAGIGAIYLLGCELFNRRAGLAAAFLLAVNPYHIGWSQDARAYTLWTLLITLAYWTLVRGTRNPARRTWWVAYLVLMTLAFYAHFFTGFVLLSQALWILLRRRKDERVAFAVAVAGLAVAVTPLLVFAMSNTDGSQLRHVPIPKWKDLQALGRLFTGNDRLQAVYLALVIIGVAVTIVRPRKESGGPSAMALLVLWLLLLPALVFGLSFLYKPLFRERYVFAALPALCLLASAGLARKKIALALLPMLLLVGALSVAALADGFSVRRDEDWRKAMSYLAANSQPDDGFIFISRRNHLPWQYYAPRFNRDPYAIHDIKPFDWRELARSRVYRAPEFDRSELDRFGSEHSRI